MNPNDSSQHRLGVALVVAAAVAWSTAPFFTRLLHFDSWTILFWRGVFAGSAIVAYLGFSQRRAGLLSLFRLGRPGWTVAALSTLGMVAFIPALQLTSVANVAVINAGGPFVAAALAWLWLREPSRRMTIIASLVAACGVIVTVGGAGDRSDIKGVTLAGLMVLAIAMMTVAVRRHRETPMVAAAAASNLLGSLVSIPFAGGITNVTPSDLSILAMFGVLQVAMGLTLFMLGSRLLPSGQAALIATLETPLMPFWVWLAFQETPSARSLIGGALVMGAVVVDTLSDARSRARKTDG